MLNVMRCRSWLLIQPFTQQPICRNLITGLTSTKQSKPCGLLGQLFCGRPMSTRILTPNRGQFTKKPARLIVRLQSSNNRKSNTTVVLYAVAAGVFMVGMGYAGVPLYRMFCQATGLGGQAVVNESGDKVESMTPIKERLINIRFNADTPSSMQWNFRPQQAEITLSPGETALAFYTAKNPTDKPIIGISTYNVIPFEAGKYFNKIQCFCFEEQRLNPHEQVDMPVFFYIDPDFAFDPKLELCEEITLSYTFFEAKEGMKLPLPGYSSPRQTIPS